MRVTHYDSECETGYVKVCCIVPDIEDEASVVPTTSKGSKASLCGLKVKKAKPLPKDSVAILMDSETNRVVLMDGDKTFVIPHIRSQGTYTALECMDLFTLRLNKSCYNANAARQLQFEGMSPRR